MTHIPAFSRVEVKYTKPKEKVLDSGIIIPKKTSFNYGYVELEVVALGPEAFLRDGKVVMEVNVGDNIVCKQEHLIEYQTLDGEIHFTVPDQQILSVRKGE